MATTGMIAGVAVLGVIVITGAVIGALMAQAAVKPAIRPETYFDLVRQGKIDPKKPVVCLLGDSHTHCTYGYNWVTNIEKMFPEFQFVNAGINGERSDQVLARLSAVIALQPRLITIIVGSNDRLSSTSRCAACAYGQCLSPRSLDHFREDMGSIITSLLERTPAALAVMSIPPVEAEPGAKIHRETQIVNAHLQELCVEAATSRCLYVPLAEKFLPFTRTTASGGLFDVNTPPRMLWTPSRFVSNTMKVQFLRWVCCKPYESLSQRYDLKLTSDCLHFNKFSAMIVLNSAATFIKKYKDYALGKSTLAPLNVKPHELSPHTSASAGDDSKVGSAADRRSSVNRYAVLLGSNPGEGKGGKIDRDGDWENDDTTKALRSSSMRISSSSSSSSSLVMDGSEEKLNRLTIDDDNDVLNPVSSLRSAPVPLSPQSPATPMTPALANLSSIALVADSSTLGPSSSASVMLSSGPSLPTSLPTLTRSPSGLQALLFKKAVTLADITLDFPLPSDAAWLFPYVYPSLAKQNRTQSAGINDSNNHSGIINGGKPGAADGVSTYSGSAATSGIGISIVCDSNSNNNNNNNNNNQSNNTTLANERGHTVDVNASTAITATTFRNGSPHSYGSLEGSRNGDKAKGEGGNNSSDEDQTSSMRSIDAPERSRSRKTITKGRHISQDQTQ